MWETNKTENSKIAARKGKTNSKTHSLLCAICVLVFTMTVTLPKDTPNANIVKAICASGVNLNNLL